ncbi:MAG TPA: hypothetical protein VFN09_05105, partial [Rhodanobacteraceae bacterium]|nr:hypothetical protein [Rhodanobacteraceae bacterium]
MRMGLAGHGGIENGRLSRVRGKVLPIAIGNDSGCCRVPLAYRRLEDFEHAPVDIEAEHADKRAQGLRVIVAQQQRGFVVGYAFPIKNKNAVGRKQPQQALQASGVGAELRRQRVHRIAHT